MITFRDGLTIGGNAPIRVNCNIGYNSVSRNEQSIKDTSQVSVSQSKSDEYYNHIDTSTTFTNNIQDCIKLNNTLNRAKLLILNVVDSLHTETTIR